jgi:hypothetical protein
MKLNWKILVAFVVLIGAIFWAVDSVRTRSYSGANLNVGVGSGPITIMNPSDETIPVQLIGTGTRSFSVLSTSEDIAGSSTRQGSGRTTNQLFEFNLPPGITELTIATRGSSVSLVADSTANLDVTAQPLAQSDAQTTLIIAAVVILGSLFYISKATSHRWINRFRKPAPAEDTQPTAVPATGNPNVGRDGRMYSDS